MDSNEKENLENFRCFQKEEFEVDWIKVSEHSFGQIYKVKLKLWREVCALKCFSLSSHYRSMVEEVSKIGKVKFNYVTSVYGLCVDPPAILMEYMGKGSLDNLLTSHSFMWAKKFQMIHEVTMGMNFLHSMEPPLLHLNLKPTNILLDDHLHVKISDFGLIKWEDSCNTMTFVEHLTARGNINYAPPEAFKQNPEPPGTKYDVYSFAIVMWEILTQKKPYPGVNMTEVLIRVSTGKRPSLEKIPDDQPIECESMKCIMQQCWQQDPRQRPDFSGGVINRTLSDGHHKIPYSALPVLQDSTSQPPHEDSSEDNADALYFLSKKNFPKFRKTVRKEHVLMSFKENNSLLHYAVASTDIENVQTLLDMESPVNVQSERGYTPLIVSVLQKLYDICSLLIAHHADVNLGDCDGWTPLHFAAQNGDDRAVRLLLENKAQANIEENAGWTPMHLAAQNGHENVVRLILPRLSGLDGKERSHGRTALHLASCYGHLTIVQLLLTQGGDPNVTDYTQVTPLHLAAEEGHFRVVRLLTLKGADVQRVDTRCYSALHFASLKGHTLICRFLLNNNAQPNARTAQGWTPMHLAAIKGHHEAVLTVEGQGGDVNASGADGWTPLHLACHQGQEQVVAMLLAAGANPDVAEDTGWTALHLACVSGRFPNVLQLISHRACVNACNNGQATPLHLAARHGSVPIIKALLLNNARRDALDASGYTALNIAQMGQHEEAAKMLAN
ncbi:ankyrin repeat and protein kinase domain-containing protein 1 isoform X3 [Denticeps clupeoides]|uniref:ankyrin repeat and protein kinase domain-containing protein 1 isoform X3 n=1 Tax=Denticeps clupeoides TaxID=299321 RepID=UPI0010A39FB0|nr:ankyrin repeat and protein kinase domain-containing protein 1 isoform X3 [Denticeps clupeoides]